MFSFVFLKIIMKIKKMFKLFAYKLYKKRKIEMVCKSVQIIYL